MKRQIEGYAALGAEFNEHRDCVVRAFSLALNKPYAEIHAACKRHGREDRKGTYRDVQRRVAAEYGMSTVFLYNQQKPWLPITLAQFLREHPKGNYYLVRKGYAFTVIDGVVHDWAHGTGPRSRIILAYKAP